MHDRDVITQEAHVHHIGHGLRPREKIVELVLEVRDERCPTLDEPAIAGNKVNILRERRGDPRTIATPPRILNLLRDGPDGRLVSRRWRGDRFGASRLRPRGHTLRHHTDERQGHGAKGDD
jgi:hypothetical protein